MSVALACDVAVIGAGTAGLSAERSARQAGAATLLIDDRFAGTTCAAVGCMPSKLLLAAACAAHGARTADVFGVHATLRIDGAAVMARVQRERDKFVASAMESIAKVPASARLQGRARFVDAHTLELDGARVTAKAIVIATGARSIVPDVLAGVASRVLTNETVFELKALPRSLAVLGAGPLGLELAQAFARLGVQVSVLEERSIVHALKDERVERALREHLGRELELVLDAKLRSASLRDHGVELAWTSGARTFERVLVATGRLPALEGLALDHADLELDEHGVPRFDPHTLRCGDSSIFIAGDADHRHAVLHEASNEGAIAGANAARFPDVAASPRKVKLTITFLDPNVAVVGDDFDPATQLVGTASYEDQGRAKIAAANVGLVRLYTDRRDGRLRGATLFGPAVEHTAHLVAWAIQHGMTAKAVLELPLYHPTFEEGIKPALQEIAGHHD